VHPSEKDGECFAHDYLRLKLDEKWLSTFIQNIFTY
jgi:hypothetical protein